MLKKTLIKKSIFILNIFMVGAILGSINIAYSKDRYADLQMFTKVLNLIEQSYVDTVDTKKIIYGGIKGMLQALEPHTNFLPPDIYKEFKEETAGEYGGIGIEITTQNEMLTVISPIDDTPAFIAGIKAGDKIVEINGVPTKGMNVSEAITKMRGKKGTAVSIKVYREGWEKPQEFNFKRDIIKSKSVKYTDLGGGIGYYRITSFIERTSANLVEAIAKHEKQNGKSKGIIIDLRNNPGGLLDQAIQVVNTFVSDGVIVSTMGRNKKEKEVYTAKKSLAKFDAPIAVLINEYSASASEIVAGAIQDHKRGIIMGNRSFGKGSVQSVIDLGDGAGLKITVARYYTPKGRSIQAQGIEPDIKLDSLDPEAYDKAVIKREGRRESDIEGHLANDFADKATEAEALKKTKTTIAKEVPKDDKKVDDKLSPKDLLMKKDMQVASAYNYLKSWDLIKFQGGYNNPKTLEAGESAISAPPASEKPESN